MFYAPQSRGLRRKGAAVSREMRRECNSRDGNRALAHEIYGRHNIL
jgi:hypothetical protein